MAELAKVDPSTDSSTLTFTAAGDRYPYNCRIIAITWQGATTAGDAPVLRDLSNKNKVLWEGRADGTNTYQGISYPWPGLDVRGGINCEVLPAGRITVALAQS